MNHEMQHPKFGVPVRIAMSDGTQSFGVVFVRQNQRVLDMLCDARAFFPIETTEGVRLLNKHHALQIDLMSIEEMRMHQDAFPEVDFQYLHRNTW